MTQYIRPSETFKDNDNKITIQPLTRVGNKRFSLWDNEERKMYNEGYMLNMPTREEQTEVNNMMKLTEEEKKRFRWTVKVRRDVIFSGEEWVYDMPPSVDKDLVRTMETVEKMGKDALGFSYDIIREKTGDNVWDVKYQVVVGEETSESTTVNIDLPDIELNLNLDDEDLILTSNERLYVTAIKKKYSDYASRDSRMWVQLLKKEAGVSHERAVKITAEHLSE